MLMLHIVIFAYVSLARSCHVIQGIDNGQKYEIMWRLQLFFTGIRLQIQTVYIAFINVLQMLNLRKRKSISFNHNMTEVLCTINKTKTDIKIALEKKT